MNDQDLGGTPPTEACCWHSKSDDEQPVVAVVVVAVVVVAVLSFWHDTCAHFQRSSGADLRPVLPIPSSLHETLPCTVHLSISVACLFVSKSSKEGRKEVEDEAITRAVKQKAAPMQKMASKEESIRQTSNTKNNETRATRLLDVTQTPNTTV